MTSEPWALGLVGNSVDAAQSAVHILAGHGIDADAIDPASWLIWHLDQGSVVYLRDALVVALGTGAMDRSQKMGIESLLEDCQEWLSAHFDPERALRED
jgi:hypothetical protein